MNIKIFPQEVSDNLETLIKNNSIAYLAEIKQKPVEDIKTLPKAIAQANPNQIDLFYLESILASIGWNNNDDVFDAMELWAARNSPVDKPFNFMHNETDIIGHITSSKVVAFDGNIITDASNLNQAFDIVVGSVIYTRWENKDRQEKINSLLSGIENGDWFVSMECMFPDFDYALIAPDGSHKTIARTEESSYLTKYLRLYGGPGSYQGYKLGRLLRNFTFSGKGLVNKPANPRSDILGFNSKREISVFNTAAEMIVQEINMADVINVTKEQYDTLVSEHAKATASMNDVTTKLAQAESKITELVKAEASVRSILDETVKAKDAQISELKTNLTKANEQLAEAEMAAKKMKDEKAKCERMNKLKCRQIDDAKAEELVNKFSGVADELFDEIVSAYPIKETTVATVEPTVETTVDTVATAKELEKASASALRMTVPTENKNADLHNKMVGWLTGSKKK